MKRGVLSLFYCLFSTSLLFSQWWYYPSSLPQEKRFEDQSFFFSPTFVNPYGVDEFSSALSGIVDHPLMNLQINPASISSIGNVPYIYIDYRTDKELARKTYADVIPAYIDVYRPYPIQYGEPTKLSVEPAFSTAMLAKPFPEAMPRLSLGFSYELISQSEPYYPIENNLSPADDFARSVTMTFDGADHVRSNGHFIALFSGYQLSDALSFGGRIGRTIFDRDAQHGPLMKTSTNANNSAIYSDNNNHGQNYRLWDAVIGVQLNIMSRMMIGISAGYSTGDISQTELYQYVNILANAAEQPTSSSETFTDNNRHWNRSGDGMIFGVNSKATLSNTLTLTAAYSYAIQNQNLSFSARDNNEYQYSNESYSNGNTSVFINNGAGDRTSNAHRFSAALSLKTEKNLSVSFGIAYINQHLSTATHEYVDYVLQNYSQSSTPPYATYRTLENKNFIWNDDRTIHDLQIPLILDLPLSRYVTWTLGLNRRFLTTEDSEKTIVEYLKRERYKDNILQPSDLPMYEQYNTPLPSRSTSSVSALIGFTVQPTEGFNVRLLAIPYAVGNEPNLQWLAGVNIIP